MPRHILTQGHYKFVCVLYQVQLFSGKVKVKMVDESPDVLCGVYKREVLVI